MAGLLQSYVLGYGCVTAAGQGASPLFQGLLDGVDHSRPLQAADLKHGPGLPSQVARACLMASRRADSSLQRMVSELGLAYDEACQLVSPERRRRLASGLGVIFASTKGMIEDVVWQGGRIPGVDTLTPVLTAFLESQSLKPLRFLCISNACSSFHAALLHARFWLHAGVVRDVLVLSADHVGPFVVNGFASLKSLAPDRVTPFGAGRLGIQLGEAAAAVLLSLDAPGISRAPRVVATHLLTEGHALTRSREDGRTLAETCRAALAGCPPPDVVIAHGTGTEANDLAEDHVHASLGAPVTCAKWSVGHTLGASGAIDFIAGFEMLRHAKVFAIGNTSEVDPRLRGAYLTRGQSREWKGLRRILLNSVGFGGMHASTLLEVS